MSKKFAEWRTLDFASVYEAARRDWLLAIGSKQIEALHFWWRSQVAFLEKVGLSRHSSAS